MQAHLGRPANSEAMPTNLRLRVAMLALLTLVMAAGADQRDAPVAQPQPLQVQHAR